MAVVDACVVTDGSEVMAEVVVKIEEAEGHKSVWLWLKNAWRQMEMKSLMRWGRGGRRTQVRVACD